MNGEFKISTAVIFLIVFSAVLSMSYTFYSSSMSINGQNPSSIGTLSSNINTQTSQWSTNLTSRIGNETTPNPQNQIFAAFNIFLSTAVNMVDIMINLPGLVVGTTTEITNIGNNNGFTIPPEFTAMILSIVAFGVIFAIIKFRGGRSEL